MCRSPLLVVSLALAFALTTTAARAQAPRRTARTAKHHDTRTAAPGQQPRSSASPRASATDIARAYLTESAADFGLTPADVADVAVASVTTSGHSGVTHVYLRQRFRGIDVHGADMNVNVTRDGAILGAGTSFVPNLRAAISGTTPGLDGAGAGAAAAAHLRKPIKAVTAARLVYEPLASGEVALAWLLSIEEAEGNHLWEMTVDATTGAVFEQTELTVHDVWPEPDWAATSAVNALVTGAVSADGTTAATLAEPADVPLASVPVPGVPGSGTYKVFAWPSADPNDGPRSIVVDPADALSSPFGWHDVNGLPGAESDQTVGNNVEAYVDPLNDNVPTVADRATGVGGVFDFPIDFTADPSTYQAASVTNLFYWTNFIHDVSYRYGFTEEAGNFQANNYGRFNPGDDSAPPDSLRAEAQDGAGMDNSNFTTPADNNLFPRPRMQVFNWVPVGGYEVQVQTGVAVSYPAVRANFRPFLADSRVIQPTAIVQPASPANGCASFVGFPAGAIAYVDPNTCSTLVKATNARNAGAIGVIINTGLTDAQLAAAGPLTASTTAGVGIPVLGISASTAASLRPTLPAVARMAFVGTAAPLRDGDFDAAVILHEYTHGISNRLTGGRLNTACLVNQEQMGEGWSDWLALALTDDPNRADPRSRGIGPYLRFTGSDGVGVRPTRYSPDFSIDPVTYGLIASGPPAVPVPVRTGYAWASMLWDVYWDLVDRHGFNPNVYDAWNTGGNNLAIQLVIDGMKLQPCRPGFVDGRNAILQADQVLTGGANQCTIWRGFARRGLGFSASQGSAESILDGTEAFDLPVACQPRIVVTPAELGETLVQNRTESEPVRIANVTEDAGSTLNWTLTETLGDCSVPVDLPWVSASAASGIAPAGGASELVVTYSAAGLKAGTYAGKLCIAAPGAATVEVPISLNVQYDFRGFDGDLEGRQPEVDAGDEVKVKFSLTGFQGFDIFAAGAPSSRKVDCATGTPLSAFEAATIRRRTTLEYDPLDDEYRWRWQTSTSWGKTCREFSLGLADGSTHTARIRFDE